MNRCHQDRPICTKKIKLSFPDAEAELRIYVLIGDQIGVEEDDPGTPGHGEGHDEDDDVLRRADELPDPHHGQNHLAGVVRELTPARSDDQGFEG